MDVNADDPSGSQALHHAAISDGEKVQALLDGGATIDTCNKFGVTALHLAASSADPGAVQVLLDGGADPEIRNLHGWSAMDAIGKDPYTGEPEAVDSHMEMKVRSLLRTAARKGPG